ncbi:MAG: hypothetical protein M8866_08130 [marine benthic group bacterium]|nr:hypothetical protein [Candidatus Benthicola marisminoris]
MSALRLLPVLLVGGCVYFNALYDANREYDDGLEQLQEQSQVLARVHFDSVIAKTGRIVDEHPDSKYADDAAILKTRAELHTDKWESAAETAARAEDLAGSVRSRATAVGLRGVALRELGRNAEADSLLSVGLAGDLDGDDEALFLFQRGLARQSLGRSDEAAVDLEAAATSAELTSEGRLSLSIALRDIGDYHRSAELAAGLLVDANPNPRDPLYLHADSLAVLAPDVVDSLGAELLESPAVAATRLAAFHYLMGRARLSAGRTEAALESFDAAIAEASTSQAASHSAYYMIEVRLSRASRPEDVRALAGSYPLARRVGDSKLRARASRWQTGSEEFDGLISAYEGRGASAAEAVLRAAEVAQIDLYAPALARGGYLLYLQVAPESPWAAKAMIGALSLSGATPDAGWVEDRGAQTDAELRRRFEELPADDPYRVALAGTRDRDAMSDSMYVLAEADLDRRLTEIRMLFDPTAADTVPAQDQDEIQVEPDEDEIQN